MKNSQMMRPMMREYLTQTPETQEQRTEPPKRNIQQNNTQQSNDHYEQNVFF